MKIVKIIFNKIESRLSSLIECECLEVRDGFVYLHDVTKVDKQDYNAMTIMHNLTNITTIVYEDAT